MADGERYDVIVVGGGPAGSSAALCAARGGCRVALFERSERPGTPVRCGEAVGTQALEQLVKVEPSWIGTRVNAVRMVSPNGTPVQIDQLSEGYILRRDEMDADLAQRARHQGVDYRNLTTIVSVAREGREYACVDQGGEEYRALCLILADGVESRLARQLGWQSALRLEDLSSCAFGRVAHDSVPKNVFEMHYGSSVAPGGYGWVFPRGDGSANVGLGVLGSRSQPGLAMACLPRFVERIFPGAELTHVHCGGVPVGRWTRRLVREGAMIVGDAARQVDALTGGGITHAIMAGQLAGKAAANAFDGGTFSSRALRAYEQEFARGPGKQLLRTFALKQMVIGFDDRMLDSIAHRLSKTRTGNLSLARICLAAFARRPLLLLKALSVYR